MTSRASPRRQTPVELPLLLAGTIFACFLPALSGQFLNYDDDFNITGNQGFRGLSLSHLRWMFTHLTGHYHPLTWLSLGVDYTIWGMNPLGYHLTNVLLHVFGGLLAYFMLVELIA